MSHSDRLYRHIGADLEALAHLVAEVEIVPHKVLLRLVQVKIKILRLDEKFKIL